MTRNHWVEKRTDGESKRPVQPGKVNRSTNQPTNTNGIWYYNHLAAATGDIRAYAILGLYNRIKNPQSRVSLIVKSGMSGFMQKFLTDCHVNVFPEVGDLPRPNKQAPNYCTYANPGNLFEFQKDVMSAAANVPQEVRELSNLNMVIPLVRTSLGVQTGLMGTDTLIIHVKPKAYNGLNCGDRKAGINYHEEHKLSYTLCLALAKVALGAGWKVWINDDHNRIGDKPSSALSGDTYDRADNILLAAGYTQERIDFMDLWGTIESTPRQGLTMREQYINMANYGTTNVRHVGGRSGHLEFMMYLGQKVYYCEEPGAQGANRIFTTFGTLQYQGETLMNRCVMIPTTAGGRAEMEYRYEATQLARFEWLFSNTAQYPREDGLLVDRKSRVPVSESSVDRYKVIALKELVTKLGLPEK
ncbi:hypothetical protein [Thalassomonas sp. RHCl1]|uniref:hypothetical protein n=1 Tax=Thalassomonas sp. RHCl1 TaxID=2995320 RepID=UPI00248B2727|nr:hypothetical protein [Thalassomonas sp. RHCl1]